VSSNPLVPSFRYANAIPPGAAHSSVVQAIRAHDNSLTDLSTAIPILVSRISSLESEETSSSSSSSSSTTTSGVSSFNAETGAIEFFPDLGTVDDQSGETTYVLQDQDNGAFLVFNDASAIAVSLNPNLVNPFITTVMNMGTGTVTFSATAPETINSFFGTGSSSINLLPGYLCVIALNGQVWNFGTLPIVPVNTPAVTHEWFNSYDSTNGTFGIAQPSFSDLSGELQSGQLLSGVSGSLGGSSMAAGQSITSSVAIAGATTSMVAACSPVTYPGDGFVWDAYVSAANTVTVRLTATLSGTPSASTYNVRVLP
jgi:hypothetical protein